MNHGIRSKPRGMDALHSTTPPHWTPPNQAHTHQSLGGSLTTRLLDPTPEHLTQLVWGLRTLFLLSSHHANAAWPHLAGSCFHH